MSQHPSLLLSLDDTQTVLLSCGSRDSRTRTLPRSSISSISPMVPDYLCPLLSTHDTSNLSYRGCTAIKSSQEGRLPCRLQSRTFPSSMLPTPSNQIRSSQKPHHWHTRLAHKTLAARSSVSSKSGVSATFSNSPYKMLPRSAFKVPTLDVLWRNRSTNTLQRSTSRALAQAVHVSVVPFSAVLSSPTLPHRQYHLSYNLWHNYNLPFLAATPPLNPSSKPPTPNTQS
jgi:hypothetical protein